MNSVFETEEELAERFFDVTGGETPQSLFDRFVDGVDEEVAIGSASLVFDGDILRVRIPWLAEVSRGASRTIDFSEGIASHDLFTVPRGSQAKGVGRQLNANFFEWYEEVGIHRIETHAVGGPVPTESGVSPGWFGSYTWSRFGFLPYDPDGVARGARFEWNQLKDQVRAIDPETADSVEIILDAADEDINWQLADLSMDYDGLFGTNANGKNRTLGFMLMAPGDWQGFVDLDGGPGAERFRDYVKGARKKDVSGTSSGIAYARRSHASEWPRRSSARAVRARARTPSSD